MNRYLTLFMQLALWIALPAYLRAEKFALVMGVGRFLYLSEKNNLAGARPDAEKMVEILTTKYGFRRENIILLLDKEGTRDAFLGGIEQITQKARNGDQVVIYFSGHGTSAMDDGGFGMDADTGAVIPSDLKPANTKEEVLAQLILGKRDLRPLLGRLEQKANVLVIFDACFSGESVKGVSTDNAAQNRYISLSELTNGDVSSRSIAAAERASSRGTRDYPYNRVVYFSAASKGQPAWDMPAPDFPTFDGVSHGAFTNIFLKLLSDGAGTRVGCGALYNQVFTMVHEQAAVIRHSQDPQFLYSPANAKQIQSPCLSPPKMADAPAPPPPPSASEPPSPGTQEIRTEIDSVAAGASFKLQCSASKPYYRSGEYTVVSCNLPDSGYLQIFSYGMGDPHPLLVFPNAKHTGNAVSGGPIEIPSGGEFSIENYLPESMTRQQQVMLVVFSKGKMDARSLGVPEGIFTSVPTRELKSQRVVGPEGYGATELVFDITK